MEKKIKRSSIFKYVLYKRMLLSYILILSLTIICISSVLYFVFSNKLEESINNRNMSMLEQTIDNSQKMMDAVVSTCYALYENNYIITALYSTQPNSMEIYRAVQQVRSVKAAYPYIEHVGMYNFNSGQYFGTRGVVEGSKLESSLMQALKASKSSTRIIFPQTVNNNIFAKSTLEADVTQVISMIIYSSLGDAAIIIDIPQQKLLSIFEHSTEKDAYIDDVKVFSSEGIVISDLNPENFNHPIDTNLKNNIDSNYQTPGFLKMPVSKTKSVITYKTLESYGWTYLITSDYNQLVAELSTLRIVILSIALLMMVIGIFYSYYVSRKLHTPIDTVLGSLHYEAIKDKSVNEMLVIGKALETAAANQSILENTLKHSDEILFSSDICTLLNQGTFQHLGSRKRINERLKGPYFCACAVYHEIPDTVPNENEEKILNEFIYENVLTEILEAYSPVITHKSNSEIAIILQNDSPQFKDASSNFNLAQDTLSEWYSFSFSVGIGTVTDQATNLCESYVDALDALNAKYTLGPNAIIFYDTMEREKSASHYPADQEKIIFTSISKYNIKETEKNILLFTDTTRQFSSMFSKIYNIQLALNIMSKYEHILSYMEYDEAKYYNTIINSSDINTFSEMLIKLCSKIIDELSGASGHDKIIDKVKEFVTSNYMDSTLCLNSISEIVSLSPPYVNRIFRQRMGVSFNEYLNYIRIDESKVLLQNTRLSTSEICRKIGMANNTYFYTLFKQKVGMTPTQYRAQF